MWSWLVISCSTSYPIYFLFFQSISTEVMDALNNRSVSVRLKGLVRLITKFANSSYSLNICLLDNTYDAAYFFSSVWRIFSSYYILSLIRIWILHFYSQDCMRGSLAKARVVYAPVEEIGSEGRLMRACRILILRQIIYFSSAFPVFGIN